MMMSDILLQVSSLCDANFIIRSGRCPLEGSVRYRSMVSEDLSLQVTRSLFGTIKSSNSIGCDTKRMLMHLMFCVFFFFSLWL